MSPALAFIVSMALALALTPLWRRVAGRCGAIDCPVERSSHCAPTPTCGGFAIYIAFWVTVVVSNWPPSGFLLGMMVGSLLLLAVCFVDDTRGLPPGPRLLAQFLVAGIAWYAGVRVVQITNPLADFFGPQYVFMGWASAPVTMLWIVFIINAVNWLDGLDGLAAGVSSIAALTLAVVAAVGGQMLIAVAAAALAGGALGFLRYNFNPAQIFMGDVGAMFLGYALACLSVVGAVKVPTGLMVLVPMLVLGLPIYDSTSTIVKRALAGRPIYRPDRTHLHHRLLDSGLSTRETVVLMYGITGFLCVVALGVWLR